MIAQPSIDSSDRPRTLKLLLACLVVPCLLVGFILAISPNFSAHTSGAFNEPSVRPDPLGGDLLQEYVGGHIWKTNRERLYDWDYSASLQHDEKLVGFMWEETGFFPMVYPPFHYQFASLSSHLPYKRFVWTWMFASAIALSIAAFAFLMSFEERRFGSGSWFLVAVLFTPLLLSLNMGQKSSFILAILAVTFSLLHKKRPFTAGMVFGLIAFKPYLALVIGSVMLVKLQFRFIAGSLLVLLLLLGISWTASPAAWTQYLEVCFGMGDYISNSGYQLDQSHSLWGSTEMLFGHWYSELVKPFTLIATIGVFTLLGKIMSGPIELSSSRFAFQFSACVIATVLVSPHFYTYDLTILLLPLAICGLSADLDNRINRRFLYWICFSVLFGASLYSLIAINLGIQISTIILFAWLATISGGWKAVDLLSIGTFSKSQPGM